ncbi:MAG: family 2 glycosyl transferase [uncultured bacterium]|nr:MAG: family 2 glycosyl transferase [uncultured bacterium]
MKKIKVGFGPKTTANSFTQSGIKVAKTLNDYEGFEAATFGETFEIEDLAQFDVLVFIKILPEYNVLKELKILGKKIIFDYHDAFLIPTAYETNLIKKILKSIYYFNLERAERKKYSLIDLCFVASKGAEQVAKTAGLKTKFLFRQIFNDWNEFHFKQHTEKSEGLVIGWTGVSLNIDQNAEIKTVLEKLCKKYNSTISYLTDVIKNDQDEEVFKYKLWSLETWEKDILEWDISFRWWLDSNHQRHKDSNKIISYMAAGIPVVCRPTNSDEEIIKNGETGFFANNICEFEEQLDNLIKNPKLRKYIGENAHKYVWQNYSLRKHVDEIKKTIEEIMSVE